MGEVLGGGEMNQVARTGSVERTLVWAITINDDLIVAWGDVNEVKKPLRVGGQESFD